MQRVDVQKTTEKTNALPVVTISGSQSERRELHHAMKHIGIAGVTIPGSLLTIDTILQASQEYFGGKSLIHPQITYTNPPLADINPAIQAINVPQVATDLLDSMDRLAAAGADFAIIPSNAPHYAIKRVQEASPIEVMSIIDVTVEEAVKRGFHKVGIMGVGPTMFGGLFVEPLSNAGIEAVNLPPDQQKALHELIFSEIIQAKPTPQTAEKMKSFIQKLKDLGCDAFIAGCTEIPLVVSEETSPLPYIDTTRLLAQKAFEKAVGLN